MANRLGKLPPEVARELLRHVRPRAGANGRGGGGGGSGGGGSNGNKGILIGCVAFVGAAASLPYWATQTIGNLTARDEPLTRAQVRRGPFMNSGTIDAGRDPNWDWKNGTYVYPKGFAEHLRRNADPNDVDLGPDLGPMVREEREQRDKGPR